MKDFKAKIQIPSGESIDVTPQNGMPIVRGLLEGTDYVPELVTSLWFEAKSSDGRIVKIILPTIDGLEPVVDILEK